ncbi:MAG: lipocalin family protein [Deltaproteobacteria bacterium]|nr:lipocalin family protein [Deltaproteobacteria bacterium]
MVLGGLVVVLLSVAVIMFSCFLPGLRETAPDLPTVAYVDIERYQGKWYEIARLPTWFQRTCAASTATYQILGPGKISVENECREADGGQRSIRGTATVVDPKTNAKLEVAFDTWVFKIFGSLIKGKYWILDLDADYQTALVGTPDRHYLWILARTPTLPEERYQALVRRARELDFKTENLIRNLPPAVVE